MSKRPYNPHRKTLKQLSGRLRALLAESSGEISQEAQAIMRQIRLLIQQLRGRMSRREISRILGAAAIFFGLGYSQQAAAQNFDNPVANPFGFVINNYLNIPTTVDIDGDGDLDIFTGVIGLTGYYPGPGIEFHENTGTAQMPQFAAAVTDTFNIDISALNSFVTFPTFGDLDGDGDYDMLGGGSYLGLFYFENVGTAQSPDFAAPVANPFGLNDSVYYGSPILLDLDNDGDLDLLSGEYDGRVVYYENTGSATSPAFGPKQYEPFGLQTTYYFFPTAGDVDWDGDLDLIVADYYGDLHYFENTGTKTNPQFAAPVANPSNLVGSGTISFPAMADLDGDSDPDLLVGEGTFYTGVAFNYYENLATGIGLDEVSAGISIYPSLVEDQVTIESESELSEIRLMDVNGAYLRSWDGDVTRIDLSDLAPGPYLLEINTRKGSSVASKLVKK